MLNFRCQSLHWSLWWTLYVLLPLFDYDKKRKNYKWFVDSIFVNFDMFRCSLNFFSMIFKLLQLAVIVFKLLQLAAIAFQWLSSCYNFVKLCNFKNLATIVAAMVATWLLSSYHFAILDRDLLKEFNKSNG